MNKPQSDKISIEKHINRHSINQRADIREAMARLDSLSGDSMTLFAIDDDGNIKGAVTDGDIRRALVKGAPLDAPVEKVMFKNFIFGTPKENLCGKIAEGRSRGIDLMPIVEDGKIVYLIDLKKVRTSLPIDAVLMAGGKGERLRPLTLNTPKPLLPVGNKPIINYNVEALEECGVNNIFVTVNYLANQIERHFKHWPGNSRILCVREPKRLGTIGSLSLIEGFEKEDVLVMNSDLLTTIDFEAFYLHHLGSGADLTIATVPYSVSVPFAILRMEGECVAEIEEKPTYNYFANAGVYIMRRRLIERLPKGEYMDAPDFIASLISDGFRVGCFPVDGTWIDIGSPDDYRHANEMAQRLR